METLLTHGAYCDMLPAFPSLPQLSYSPFTALWQAECSACTESTIAIIYNHHLLHYTSETHTLAATMAITHSTGHDNDLQILATASAHRMARGLCLGRRPGKGHTPQDLCSSAIYKIRVNKAAGVRPDK